MYTPDGTFSEVDDFFNGFSWSAIGGLIENGGEVSFEVYLPFPYYKDSDLIEGLMAENEDVGVGKFLKKSTDPLTVALVIIASNYVLHLLAKPLWKEHFEDRFLAAVEQHRSTLKRLWERGISTDLFLKVAVGKNTFDVRISPSRTCTSDSLSDELLEEAIEKLKDKVETLEEQRRDSIERARIVYDENVEQYELVELQIKGEGSISLLKEEM